MASIRGLILVVDDNLPSRDMLSRRLQRSGCTAITADGGEEALEIIERQDVDVVLLDVTTPGMDGLTVLERVRQSRSMTQLPIIIVTARDDSNDIMRGFQLGANDYITKPLDFPVVLSRVQTHLLVKKMRVELDAARSTMKRELQAATRLHQSLAPKASPDVPNVKFSWGLYACEELAGDVLDVIQIDGNHIGCFLLDVSGRGVEAVLFACTLSRVMSRMASDSLLFKRTPSGKIEIVPPATVMSALNRKFAMQPEAQRYFTLLYGVLDAKQREFRYVSAGHTGVLHLPCDRPAVMLPSKGHPIGWFKGSSYEETVVQVEPGDRFYIYSNGITQASNDAGDFYGARLIRSLHEARDHSLDNSIGWLVADVRDWCAQTPPQDDIAVLAFEMTR